MTSSLTARLNTGSMAIHIATLTASLATPSASPTSWVMSRMGSTALLTREKCLKSESYVINNRGTIFGSGYSTGSLGKSHKKVLIAWRRQVVIKRLTAIVSPCFSFFTSGRFQQFQHFFQCSFINTFEFLGYVASDVALVIGFVPFCQF